MQLLVYNRLQTQSRRAFKRAKTKLGDYRYYIPNVTLMKRLKAELGMDENQIITQIQKERAYLFRILK